MNVHEKIQKIRTLIFDVDGVFTDGSIIVTEDGNLLRQMNTRDGFAVKRALDLGFNIAIITAGNSLGVKKRFNMLGIEDVFLSVENKYDKFLEYLEKNNIDPDTVLYMGDDILDLEVLKNVFLSVCPRDACHEVLEVCQYISNFDGGKGCVREIIEKILASQNMWLTSV